MAKKIKDADDYRILTLVCSKCGHEWIIPIDADSPPAGSLTCPNCFYDKVYLKSVM